jgi:hypothetical protein
MEPVVGIFSSRSAAAHAAGDLREQGWAPESVQLLFPESSDAKVARVPIEDAEQPGVGKALGGVVGGAVGAAAGLGLGAAVASLFIPGVGAVSAVGLAAAALFGAGGAVGGAAAAGALENEAQTGLPRDELYLYEDALAHGRSVVFALARSEQEADAARRAFEAAGAESLDAAREAWWIGLKDAEKAHYESTGADWAPAEFAYRQGFAAALHSDLRGRTWEEARDILRERKGDVADTTAFRAGYERGRVSAGRVLKEADRQVPVLN